jgi:hypothetical protein
MNLWRRTRTELAGAWRSARYDMGRRPAEPADGPDVTSTGMSTFAVPAPGHGRRRLVAASAFGALAVAGAAGAYLAVDGGLASVVTGKPAEAQQYPLAAAVPPAGDTSTAGMGRGPVSGGRSAAAAADAPAADPIASVAAPAPARVLPRAARTAPERVTQPAVQPCPCPAPPVPTPTQPSPPPSAPPSPSPSPSESASPSASASPSTSASAEALMRRSHSRSY